MYPAHECFYCTQDQRLSDLMVEVCKLSVSTVFIFKEQTYAGRCNVVFNAHGRELADLSSAEQAAFMADVACVGKAVTELFHPDKVNYGAYADKMSHLHMHVVPKYADGHTWGSVFEMNPGKVYLSDEAYTDMADKLRKLLL